MADETFEIDIHLRRVATGEVRVVRDKAWPCSWKFQWSDGNFGCDCNRDLFFTRAGVGEEDNEGRECGDTAFVIDKVVDVASGATLLEGDPRDAI